MGLWSNVGSFNPKDEPSSRNSEMVFWSSVDSFNSLTNISYALLNSEILMNQAYSKFINSSKLLKTLAGRSNLIQHHFHFAVDTITTQLKAHAFLRVKTSNKSEEWLMHAGLVWNPVFIGDDYCTPETGTTKLDTLPTFGKNKWRLPSGQELLDFANKTGNPWRPPSGDLVVNDWYWTTKDGAINLNFNDAIVRHPNGKLLAVTDARITSCFGFCDSDISDFQSFVIYAFWKDWIILAVGDASNTDLLKPLKTLNLQSLYQSIDNRSAKLPLLTEAQFTDPAKGLWEFWGLDPKELESLGLRARNPADDIQPGNVAIDFGTSSTVVAIEQNGIGQLLRIGVSDFWEKPQPAHYENPTVLEFVDFDAMLRAWQAEAYRPGVLWDDVRCSHEALQNFRGNDTNPKVVASILTKIKQWALREGERSRLRLTDQTHSTEHELPPLTLRQPVKGKALEVSDQDPFDPAELYAWFLGMTINWRKRGIFLRYYMTFPVDYPREVKEKILASFRRGLQRSLPATLVEQSVFGEFTVEERASEPAAYAAIALQSLNIAPTPRGVAYAVFDFGGGTTDFDFGYYRLPTDAEDRNGVEYVFEHFGNGGDKFLGGENLLGHLAYKTFRHNLEVCRSKLISFAKPLDDPGFQGSEMFLEQTQAANTNSLMLVSKLRSFWEAGEESKTTGIVKIDLLDRDGKKATCEFSIPHAELKAFLQERIEQGVHNFFIALQKAFGNEVPAQVEVLLAGNASRSKIVLGLFGLLPEEDEMASLKERTSAFLSTLFPTQCPELTAHAPLPADAADVNRPTGKTGVALGLLKLCPGSSTLVVNHAAQNAIGDAPFQHYVGRIRQTKFQVSLHQGDTYHQWVELGPVRERVFNLYHSQSPRAYTGEMKLGDPELIHKRQDFAGNTEGMLVFVRPVKPNEVELCTAASLEAVAQGAIENMRTLKLV